MPLFRFRLRFLTLWISQVARVSADFCLRTFIVLQAARAGPGPREAAWHLVVALFILPAILFAPFNGAISNSLPKRSVLAGSAAFCLLATALFAALGGGWWTCLALVAIGSALYSPTRFALLPAVAIDTRWPLSRVNGFIEMGAGAAIIFGMIAAAHLDTTSMPSDLSPGFGSLDHPVPLSIAFVLLASLVAVLFAIPAAFPSDVRRPEPPGQAIAGFFRDTARILRDRSVRNPLLGWAAFRGLIAALTGAVVASTLSDEVAAHSSHHADTLIIMALWIMSGAAAGAFLAGLQGHPLRSRGIIPLGLTGLAIALIVASIHTPGLYLAFALGLLGGLVNVPLGAAYQASLPADARGNGMSIFTAIGYICMTLLSLLMAGLAYSRILGPSGQFWFIAALMTVGACIAWKMLLREALEFLTEIVLAPIYRMHGYGPGLERFPQSGPVILIANHSSWLDPLWLGKHVPRPVYPMMTSTFYDLPVIHWLMVHVIRAIRVPAVSYRRQAPELAEAIAVLDRGQCLVVFPEGKLRRSAEVPVWPFGRGVWHILRERPDTPVIPCWIEGGWGSFCSYYNGPPATNKRLDWWRSIDIAYGEPEIIDPALLQDQRRTRTYLQQACLRARTYLGLPPFHLGAEEALYASDDSNGAA